MPCGLSCRERRWLLYAEGITKTAEQAVMEVIRVANDPDDQGGYFFFASLSIGDEIPPVKFGKIPDGFDEEFSGYAKEKVYRTYQNQDLSSWQSRDVERSMFGGAVIGEDDIKRKFGFGFSGLKEHRDEAAMLLTATRSNMMTAQRAREIALMSDNQFYLENWG